MVVPENVSISIILDNVVCQGQETSLFQCTHNDVGVHDCDNSNIAGVKCEGNGQS